MAALTGIPPMWLAGGLLALCFVLLAAWGETVRRLLRHVERAHPAWFAELRAKSRKSGRLLAASASLQSALAKRETPPEVLADPAAARLIRREAGLRAALWPMILIAFLVFALA